MRNGNSHFLKCFLSFYVDVVLILMILFIFVVNGKFQKSGVTVEFSCLGFRVLAPGNMDAELLDSTLCNLFIISHQQETKSLSELKNCYETFMRYN